MMGTGVRGWGGGVDADRVSMLMRVTIARETRSHQTKRMEMKKTDGALMI
jgi:hypothetical protein